MKKINATVVTVEVMQDEILYAQHKVITKIKSFIIKNSKDGVVYLTVDDFKDFIKGI